MIYYAKITTNYIIQYNSSYKSDIVSSNATRYLCNPQNQSNCIEIAPKKEVAHLAISGTISSDWGTPGFVGAAMQWWQMTSNRRVH